MFFQYNQYFIYVLAVQGKTLSVEVAFVAPVLTLVYFLTLAFTQGNRCICTSLTMCSTHHKLLYQKRCIHVL